MYIILSYDVDAKRCSKYFNICKKYLLHSQNSLFEGNITKKNYKELITKIEKIKLLEDEVIIYEIPSTMYFNKKIITSKLPSFLAF